MHRGLESEVPYTWCFTGLVFRRARLMRRGIERCSYTRGTCRGSMSHVVDDLDFMDLAVVIIFWLAPLDWALVFF